MKLIRSPYFRLLEIFPVSRDTWIMRCVFHDHKVRSMSGHVSDGKVYLRKNAVPENGPWGEVTVESAGYLCLADSYLVDYLFQNCVLDNKNNV